MLRSALLLLITILYYLITGYLGIVVLYFICGWIPGLNNSRFHYVLGKICYPFMKIFSGRIIIFNFLDLGATIGLVVCEYILNFVYRLLINIL